MQIWNLSISDCASSMVFKISQWKSQKTGTEEAFSREVWYNGRKGRKHLLWSVTLPSLSILTCRTNLFFCRTKMTLCKKLARTFFLLHVVSRILCLGKMSLKQKGSRSLNHSKWLKKVAILLALFFFKRCAINFYHSFSSSETEEPWFARVMITATLIYLVLLTLKTILILKTHQVVYSLWNLSLDLALKLFLFSFYI